MYKRISILLISVLATSLYSAEGSEDSKENVFDEVVVTAQRVEQSLQDVPISVSAFSAEQMDEQQIETGGDLQVVVPSLTFVKDELEVVNLEFVVFQTVQLLIQPIRV